MGHKLIVSFSGGETSAYMTDWLINRGGAEQLHCSDVCVVFANTGQESEATLEFVRRCDTDLGFRTVWLEADINPVLNGRSSFTVVDYKSADRDGVVFEAMVRKLGLPNRQFKHCSRILKAVSIEVYARHGLGWSGHYTAIGIRVDETDRISLAARKRRLLYPLINIHPKTKAQISSWWRDQSFRLELEQWAGNCKWCCKKSYRKLVAVYRKDPSAFDFPKMLERKYARVGPEFDPTRRRDGSAPPIGYYRTMFARSKPASYIEELSKELGDSFVLPTDEMQVFDDEIDAAGGCGDSCEVYSDDDI